jgi:ceramide glucosyltransferase
MIGELLLVSLAVLSVLSLLLLLASDSAVRRHLKRRPPAASTLPPLTILKPMKGCDDELFENLSSFATQDYPEYELLLGVATWDDPAVAVARRLIAAFPERAIFLHVCGTGRGLNPKVNILSELCSRARADVVLISDSNVRAAPSYLRDTVAELADPGVGLVTHLIAGVSEATLASTFENVHSVTYVARAIASARSFLSRACVVGKSMLFRLSDFRRMGGWERVENLLAEDYVIGELFERNGYRVALAPTPLLTVNATWSLHRFVNRHVRWGQMRRRISVCAYVLEVLFNPAPLLALLALLAFSTGSTESLLYASSACLGMAGKVAADARLVALARGAPVRGRDWWCPLCKDFLVFGIWFVAAVRRTIDWRGNLFIVGPGTRLEPYAATVSWWSLSMGSARRRRRALSPSA